MRKLLLVILIALKCSISFGQSFEGKLTYEVEFDFKTQKIGNIEITKEQLIEKMKKDGGYFDTIIITIKDGDYIKEDNSSTQKKIVYKSNVNKIYIFEKDFEYVVITDASRFNAMDLEIQEPRIEHIEESNLIYGNETKLLKLSWGNLGEEKYYYNSDFLKIDPEQFVDHNYEYLNTILRITNSYPLRIIKSFNSFGSIKMTLVNVSEEKIEESTFTLPEFKKAEKDYTEMMLKLTGSLVMKLKN